MTEIRGNEHPDTGNESNEAGWYLTVDSGSDRLRLDRFIAKRIERVSRARAAKLQVVDLDQPTLTLKKSSSVHTGQRLWVKRPMPDADEIPPEPTIIYEDEQLMVLNKPTGLAVHPTASRFKSTVTWWLSEHFSQARIEPVHRLDLETSGVLVCAKDAVTNRTLKQSFSTGLIEKYYLALTEHAVPAPKWTMDNALGFHQNSAIKLRMGSGQLAAKTHFEVMETFEQLTLVRAQPVTGRQHQIRVHMAMGGQPIVGDKIYGPDENLFLEHLNGQLSSEQYERLGHHRLALHASEIGFELEGKHHLFHAEIASDLVSLTNK